MNLTCYFYQLIKIENPNIYKNTIKDKLRHNIYYINDAKVSYIFENFPYTIIKNINFNNTANIKSIKLYAGIKKIFKLKNSDKKNTLTLKCSYEEYGLINHPLDKFKLKFKYYIKDDPSNVEIAYKYATIPPYLYYLCLQKNNFCTNKNNKFIYFN